MALRKRGGIWYFRKMINGRLFRESTGFADRKAAERRANEIELDIRAGVHGWKSTIPSFAEWWDVYRKTYTPLKSEETVTRRSSRISFRTSAPGGSTTSRSPTSSAI